MGYRLSKICFTPGENEQIDCVIKLQWESRSVIHGVVKDCKNIVIKDAVVKLFEVVDSLDKCSLKPLTHAFTDECGQFLFGPLTANKHYVIKVWVDHVNMRELVVCSDDHHQNFSDDKIKHRHTCSQSSSNENDSEYKKASFCFSSEDDDDNEGDDDE